MQCISAKTSPSNVERSCPLPKSWALAISHIHPSLARFLPVMNTGVKVFEMVGTASSLPNMASRMCSAEVTTFFAGKRIPDSSRKTLECQTAPFEISLPLQFQGSLFHIVDAHGFIRVCRWTEGVILSYDVLSSGSGDGRNIVMLRRLHFGLEPLHRRIPFGPSSLIAHDWYRDSCSSICRPPRDRNCLNKPNQRPCLL